jgi:hypothetical protein
MSARHDLYGIAHKGLRSTLFAAAAELARADFGQPIEAAAAAETVGALIDALERHAEHEDAVIMPELQRLAPALHHELSADHVRTDGLQRQLAESAGRLSTAASTEERASLGRRILDQVNALVAEHLRHMASEETAANRVLWAHLTDEQLRALQMRIAASNSPAQTSAWLAVTLPAVNRSERVVILRMLRGALPAPAFEELTAQAQRALSPGVWADALAAASA